MIVTVILLGLWIPGIWIEPQWGIVLTFPIPMPVMYDAQVFPRMFTTDMSLGTAYLPYDEQIHGIEQNKSFNLEGSLCFIFITSLNDTSHCIQLYNQSAAWLEETKWETTSVMEANAAILCGWWPSRKREGVPPPQPRWARFCSGPNSSGDEGPLVRTGCLERMSMWATKDYYSFSPNMGSQFNSTFPGFNFTYKSLDRYDTNPFDLWLLYGVNGSCTDLSPMAMLGGGSVRKGKLTFDWKSTVGNALSFGHSSGSMTWTTSQVKYKELEKIQYSPPLCVYGLPLCGSLVMTLPL